MIDYVDSWQKRLRKRLYWQFKDVADWIALADMIAAQAQDMEDAAQAVLTITSIDDSVGPQLDVIGRVVKQDRLGASDAVYRMYLKAKILVNRSGGTIENIYAVFNALFGAIGFSVTYGGTKHFVLRVWGAISNGNIGRLFLRMAKESGARATLEWQQSADAQMFTFDGGDGLGFGSVSDPTQGGNFASAQDV